MLYDICTNLKHYVATPVVKEIDAIASEWSNITGELPQAKAYHVQVTVDMTKNHTITLGNADEQNYVIEVKGGARLLIARRNGNSGNTSFNTNFSIPGIQAPIRSTDAEVTLNIFIDQSSVEIITGDGITSLTNLVFPSSIYNKVLVDGKAEGRVRTLESVW